MKYYIVNIFYLLLSTVIYAQSPWTKEKGKAYLQLGGTSLIYDKVQLDGKLDDLFAKVTDITTQIYSEYGITNNLEVQLIVPYKFVSVKSKIDVLNSNNSLTGLGNITAGLKYKLLDKTWKVSGGLHYTANSITKDVSKKLSTGFNATTILTYISFGSSSGKWYYFGNLGYGYMDNNYADFLKIGTEIGYNVVEKGHIMLVFDNKIITSKKDLNFLDKSEWTSYLNRQSYSAFGLKFNYEFTKDKFGANFAALTALALDNAPVATTLNFGFYAKL